MKSLKIAIFTPYNIFKHGGVQEHVQYQAQLLRERGHDVTIITPRPRKTTEPAPDGVVFLGGSARIKTPSATSADVSVTVDNDAIDAELAKDYDIIHAHEPLIPVAARQIMSRAEGHAIRIGTFHAALPGNTIGRSIVTAYKTYSRTVLPHVDVITAVSPAAIGYIDDYTDLPINYIANGIHLDSYKPQDVERDRNMVLFIGRLEKRKGARQTIKAFRELKKMKPEATLKIAGDGPLRSSLEQYVEDNEMDDVEFLGYIEESEKIRLLNTCGVYTSPALYGESFGIVLAEAMAMKAPIVAHPNDGYSWVMQDTGRLSLVDCKNAAAYAERLQLMLEDDELRKVWQKWAAKYVKQFDYEKIVDQYESLYRSSLK
jgi:phosphatidylinositol alpha-mannosyltransferase